MVRVASIALALLPLVGCGPPLARPPVSAHTAEEFIDVPFPPPPVRSTVVPARPHATSLWVDGEWRWQVSRWRWRGGEWVVPPAGATLAAWETRRDGARVQHAMSVFHLVGGGSLEPGELRERRASRPVDACSSAAPATLGAGAPDDASAEQP